MATQTNTEESECDTEQGEDLGPAKRKLRKGGNNLMTKSF